MARTPDPDVHARRRTQLVEALFRIVRRDGIEHVSVRAVAREAGLSSGSLRYYFSTQSELLAFALEEVERRIRARLAALEPGGEPAERLERVLRELLPLTPESRVEHEIWLAFTGRAATDPVLHRMNVRLDDELRQLCARVVEGALRPGLDPELETERVYALVDGLVLHAVLRPERWDARRLGAVLRRHVEEITAGPS